MLGVSLLPKGATGILTSSPILESTSNFLFICKVLFPSVVYVQPWAVYVPVWVDEQASLQPVLWFSGKREKRSWKTGNNSLFYIVMYDLKENLIHKDINK